MIIKIAAIVTATQKANKCRLLFGMKYYAETRVLIATNSVWLFGARHTDISFLLCHVPMVWYVRIAMMI